MRNGMSVAFAFCALLSVCNAPRPAAAQPLPQLLPIQTVDKAFNDSARDLRIPQVFTLRDCGNSGDRFICTYASSSGVGVIAAAEQRVGFVERLAIGIPACDPVAELANMSAILYHIFSPRRSVATFSRVIEAMANYSDAVGPGDHWEDGVSYQVVARGALGIGLIVHRAPPPGTRPNREARKRAALRQGFALPEYACPSAGYTK